MVVVGPDVEDVIDPSRWVDHTTDSGATGRHGGMKKLEVEIGMRVLKKD